MNKFIVSILRSHPVDLLQKSFSSIDDGTGKMPIPQELYFLWDGHLARPIYFCDRIQSNKVAKSIGFLAGIEQFLKRQEASNTLAA
ncbi:hypothetical protein QUA43_25185 [Microcoleus sp. N9_B4]|uniref:hypothetical protein n=1 Tax=Microcoleus sp. N9_B4 TaxID=3055386 RepID=UPI002FD0E66A